MLSALIDRIVRYRGVIGVLLVAGVAASVYAIRTAPLDAIPDISDPQVIIYAKWPRSPQLLEAQVTEPVIKALIGSPDIRSIRATSHMGYSFIYVILRNTSRRDAVRAAVAERLNAIRQQLPPDATVSVGPNASGIGWIYEYALIDQEQLRDPRELRLLNDNQIKPALQTLPGIAEVASVGGLEKQYQLKVFPPLLADAGISLRQLIDTLRGALEEAGGRTIEVTNRDYQIRGVVNHDNIDDLEALVVGHARDGRAVLLKDVGYIQVGYDQRRGIADLNGEGEVVGGIVIMEQTQNALEITHALKERIAEIGASLPQGVEIRPTYDRSQLIWGTLKHFFVTLVYELAVVIVVTVLFLRNARTAIAPVSILLLGVLFTAMPLAAFDQTINLFSLAGLFIAIGEMVDATIVIVENCTAELAAHPDANEKEKRRIILQSIAGVARPLLFSLLIILASFLPVFFLSDKEARMFDPLAFSKTFAMAFSTLLTLFLLPIAMLWVFKRQVIKTHGRWELGFVSAYRRATEWVVRFRYPFLAVNVVLLVAAVVLLRGFRTDFMPQMEEGSILYMPTTLPGVPIKEAGWVLQQMDKKLAAFPRGGERVRQARTRGHGDRRGARLDDREHDPAQGPEGMACRHDQGSARRRDGRGHADRRLCEFVGAADQRAHGDARHGHPDAGRHQGEGIRRRDDREHRGASGASAARLSRHAVRDRGAHLVGLFHRRRVRPAAPRGSRHHGRGSDARGALRDRRRQLPHDQG